MNLPNKLTVGRMAAIPFFIACSIALMRSISSELSAAAEGCDAMYIPTDNQAATNITIIRNVTEAKGLPVICGEESMCAGGCLATVSISYYDVGKACGEQAVKILKDGADVRTMPIAYATDPQTHSYQPSHVNFGLMPPLENPPRAKAGRHAAYAARGNLALDRYAAELVRLGLLETVGEDVWATASSVAATAAVAPEEAPRAVVATAAEAFAEAPGAAAAAEEQPR